jgi:assimilatory nitrate reductase catalytic subunit
VSRKVSRAPGQALSDFAIFKLVAEAWGCGDLFRQWSSPEAAFRILRELTRNQPCDFTGIEGYDHIQSEGGIQWPRPATPGMTNDQCRMPNDTTSDCSSRGNEAVSYSSHSSLDIGHSSFRAEQPPQHRRLFEDGRFYTADQRAVFLFDEPRPMPEQPDATYPFLLNTGRGSSAQWHTGSRTNKSDVLRKLAPTSLYVEINPTDAARLAITHNSPVLVSSRRGDAPAFAVVTTTVQPGQLFMPMHFDAVNRLTFPAFDPHSRQPSYKACAVRISRSPTR